MLKEEAEAKALNFLKSQVIAVLATISPQNTPSASTIYFAVDDDFIFYFVTKVTTQKYKHLLDNHNVALVVGTENLPITVQIEGEAFEIEEVGERSLALDKVSRNSLQGVYGPPLNKMPVAEIAVYKLSPKTIRYLDQTDLELAGHGPIEIFP
jgi:uncharacterized pyridoxamine 5'-phosphate oxidase family protein